MIRPTIGFLVYGVHKDGLQDPMGQPFIDEAIIARSKQALRDRGVELVEHDTVLATKEEARAALKKMKDDDRIERRGAVFRHVGLGGPHGGRDPRFRHDRQGRADLDASRLAGLAAGGRIGVARRLARSGHPAQVRLRAADEPDEVGRIASFCRAGPHEAMAQRCRRIGTFGGRGMGQTCGAADPSQWMKLFGVDIDTRDTTELIRTAEDVSTEELAGLEPRIKQLFGTPAREKPGQRALDAALPGHQEAGGQERLGLLHDPIVPGAGRRLRRHVLRPEHDAGGRLRHLDARRFQHGHDGAAADEARAPSRSITAICSTSTSRAARSRSSATGPARRRWPASWARPDSPNTASPPKARPAGCRSSWSARWAKACWPGWGGSTASSRWSSRGARSSSRPPNSSKPGSSNAAFPSGPTASSRPTATSNELLEHWTNEYACLGYGEQLYDDLIDFCRQTGIKAILP